MKPKILLIDNDAEFLTLESRLLEGEGYEVTQAGNPEDGEKLLREDWFHLVIVDQRLVDENNVHDISGLVLARKEDFRSTAKIILTAYPDYESAVSAMRIDGTPAAIDYVAKEKGPEVISEAVKNALSSKVKLNLDLRINWKVGNLYSITHDIEPELSGTIFVKRTEELEDLFRKLFHPKDNIRIDRVLWERARRVALVVFAFKEGNKTESFLVVCGPKVITCKEASLFKVFAPKAPGINGTMLSYEAETTHFAANAYAFDEHDLENAQTLKSLYLVGPERAFNQALSNLFEVTLPSWHRERPTSVKERKTVDVYLEKLLLSLEVLSTASLAKYLHAIQEIASPFGISIETEGDITHIRYNEQTYILPDLADFLKSMSRESKSVLVVNAPGVINGENILVNQDAHTWLTDFAEAGQVPIIWNYASLEAVIRYDWTETNEIVFRRDLERCLIHGDFNKPDMRDLEPVLRKEVRAIQIIRKHATHVLGKDSRAYHQAILFHAIRRFLDFDIQSSLTSNETARIIHLLLSMSMLARSLEQERQTTKSSENGEYPELRIDPKTHMVFVGDQYRRISSRPLALLEYLYEHSDRVCTTEELRQNVIGENYNATYIHTLVGRIREAIENEPEDPHYLISEPNIGYHLKVRPEQ